MRHFLHRNIGMVPGTGLVSDIYDTLNATHSLRDISVEIHSMYTTNLALAIRSTNLEH